MVESPLIRKWRAEARHDDILAILKDRFGTVSRDVTKRLQDVLDEKKLRALIVLAVKCPDLRAFREALSS